MDNSLENEILYNLKVVNATKFTILSSASIVFFDYILTFDREIELMWKAPMGIGRTLYFLMRYSGLIIMLVITALVFSPNLSDEMLVPVLLFLSRMMLIFVHPSFGTRCLAWIRFHWVGGIIIALLSELTLQLRIYALYNRSRTIGLLLAGASILCFAGMLGIAAKVLTEEHAISMPLFPYLPTKFCVPLNLPKIYTAIWIPILSHEVLLFLLALYKGILSVRESRRQRLSGRVTMFLVVDSVFYFMIIFTTFISSEMIWLLRGQSFIEIPYGFAIAMGSVMSQRLLLNVRERYSGQPARAIAIGGLARALTDWSVMLDDKNENIMLATLERGRQSYLDL